MTYNAGMSVIVPVGALLGGGGGGEASGLMPLLGGEGDGDASRISAGEGGSSSCARAAVVAEHVSRCGHKNSHLLKSK